MKAFYGPKSSIVVILNPKRFLDNKSFQNGYLSKWNMFEKL